MMGINKAMVIIAHQDDETIGCGATIKRLSSEGSEVIVVCVTDGSTGRDHTMTHKDNIIEERNKEILEASEILSFQPIFLNYKCQNIPNNKDIFHRIISLIREYKPEIILTHSCQDKHRDHRVLYNIVREASWKSSENIMSELGEIHRVKDVWGIEVVDPHPEIDFVVDVSEYFNFKIRAFEKYKTQEKVLDGLDNYIRGLGMVRGYMANVKYGEAFKRVSLVPVKL